MPFEAVVLMGDPRLDSILDLGGTPLRPGPPYTDISSVQRVQLALKLLGHQPAATFQGEVPDGKYGENTRLAVYAFQKRAFPDNSSRWDGHVGRLTLGAMDAFLKRENPKPVVFDPDLIARPVDLIIFMSGFADDFGAGGADLDRTSGSFQFVELDNLPSRKGTPKKLRGFAGSLKTNKGIDKALAIVESNFTTQGKMIFYGFSAGAKQLTELCLLLHQKNDQRGTPDKPRFVVDLLVTIDAAARENNDKVLRGIAPCVVKNLNLFQTTAAPSGSRGAANFPIKSSEGFAATIENVDMSRELTLLTRKTQHHQIETHGHPRAMAAIKAELGP